MITLCILCGFDLDPTELATCQACVGDVRRDLAGIESGFALLPSMLGGPTSVTLGTVMGLGSAEAPLPGGDALVMLGPGSYSHAGDPSDPPAVAFELWQWAGDWCEVRREPPARVPVTVPELVAYLSGSRLPWAMSHHPAAAEFAADMARIRGSLQAVTGTLDVPERGASCPYCGTSLEREYSDSGRRCSHRRLDWRLGEVPLPAGHMGPLRLETVADRDLRMAAWAAEHARCDVGGRVDDWSCPRCHRAFDEAQYRLALRAALEAAQVEAV